MRFLLHVVGVSKLNLRFYLLKSLYKMLARVKSHQYHTSHSVFHHGLIKVLIDKELEKKVWNWSHFLFWFGFKTDGKLQEGKQVKMKLRSSNKNGFNALFA